jgi:thymidylate synthase (FAD)
MPIFVARQWVRHRTARMNEISGRYSVMRNEFYLPESGDLARQSVSNRQGRADEPLDTEEAAKTRALLQETQESAYAAYEELIGSGLARELARINLPLSLYTEMYWQIDLHNLFHFLRLRLDKHAQKEIREYAAVLLEMARKVAPLATAAFENNSLHGVRFSREETAELRARLSGGKGALTGKALERFEEKLE